MVGTTTLASIQALALISKIPPEMCYFFWFVIMLSRGGSVGLHLSFLTVIALTPRVRKPMWVFCQCWVCLYQYCSFLEPGKWPQDQESPGSLLGFHPFFFFGNSSPSRMPSWYFWESPESPLHVFYFWNQFSQRPHGTCQFQLLLFLFSGMNSAPQALAVATATDREYGCLQAAEG